MNDEEPLISASIMDIGEPFMLCGGISGDGKMANRLTVEDGGRVRLCDEDIERIAQAVARIISTESRVDK